MSETTQQAAPLWPKTITLADGRIALVAKATGREVIAAALVADNATNPVVLMMGVAWASTKIDGTPVTWEEFTAIDFTDILQLIGAVGGSAAGNLLSPARATS